MPPKRTTPPLPVLVGMSEEMVEEWLQSARRDPNQNWTLPEGEDIDDDYREFLKPLYDLCQREKERLWPEVEQPSNAKKKKKKEKKDEGKKGKEGKLAKKKKKISGEGSSTNP